MVGLDLDWVWELQWCNLARSPYSAHQHCTSCSAWIDGSDPKVYICIDEYEDESCESR